MKKSISVLVESGKARPCTEKEVGEERRVCRGREGSLQGQFNFGCVYFEVLVSHICFFLFSSPSRP